MTATSSIDLVVPTAGRTAELERYLDSVATQAWGGATRVILVDQNPDDRLGPIVASAQERIALLHLRSEPGVSRACNLALRHATAEVIGRADDDCWYTPSVLQQVVDAFLEHPEWDALSGSSCDEAGRPSQLMWDRAGGIVSRRTVFRRTIGFALFMRRSAIEAVGEWDESYGPRPLPDGTIGGGSEDGEYVLRMLAAGLTIGYEPAIRIYHPDFRPAFRDATSMRKAYSYGVDHSRLLRHYGYPHRYAAWRTAQLGAASGLFLVRGEPGRARFYAAMARGRLRGMLSRGEA